MLIWRLTFDMSGGRKQAEPAGGRPLDGGVRRLVEGLHIARAARKCLAESLGATFLRDYPGPIGPWGIVANVLVVAALKLGHPMALFVLVEAHDPSIHVVQGA
jgi:hypothetical protein